MGFNWQDYETFWKRKRKNADCKRLFRDCDLIKQDDGSFNLYWAYNIWERDPATGKGKNVRGERKPLAHITTDNVLTILFKQGVCQTSMNRLGKIIGMEVYSDTSHHRTSTHKVRVSGKSWSGRKVMPWCPPHESWKKANIPFSTGMQFRMDANGDPTELITVEEDIKLLVKNEAIQQAKADTKLIRVLIRGMARLGVFDQQIQDKLDRVWHHSARREINLAEVNYKAPLGSDAESVFLIGLEKSTGPDKSVYINGSWTKRSEEERRAMLIDNALENGMKLLRRYIYETTDGLERIKV
jgi:hypothetical protein